MNEIALHASQLTNFTQYTWYEAPDDSTAGRSSTAAPTRRRGSRALGTGEVQELNLPGTGQIYLSGHSVS